MAEVKNIIIDRNPNSLPEYEKFSDKDKKLIDSYEVNSVFDTTVDSIELHFYSPGNVLLYSDYEYSTEKVLDTSDPDDNSTSNLYINPILDANKYGFGNADIKLLYHFLRDSFSDNKDGVQFFIEEISSDRTEILALTTTLEDAELINRVDQIKANLEDENFFSEFRVNFLKNDLYIGLNVDTIEYEGGLALAIKLYEPLPQTYTVKDSFFVVDKISDSIFYEIDSETEEDPIVYPKLREANFNIETDPNYSTPSKYLNYDELFSYPISSSYYEAYSLFNDKGAQLSIDYSSYDSFIQFSSAEERLRNFKYKLDLINSYENSLSLISDSLYNLTGISGSRDYYESLIKGIVNNFDHYEKHLFYESGSYSWPKSTTSKPHTNLTSTNAIAQSWYNSQLTIASSFDSSNYSGLSNAIPSFIREDSNNDSALLFAHMLGQHFDNIYIYTKAVTDKYDNDNRLNVGISKDLVEEVLKNFGVKLYNSENSLSEIFKLFTGESYASGSAEEIINNYITVPDAPVGSQPLSTQNYTGEVYKRIYHNLPLLLKSKGTERGMRALINCFGVPADILDIKLYGGEDVEGSKFIGLEKNVTSSLDKIRIENSGSIISGSTLSQHVSIKKPETIYTEDIHRIEIGFSPSDAINEYITSTLSSDFNIGDYLGDPREGSSYKYDQLQRKAAQVLGSVNKYQLNDFVRLIKFFDNVLFKMIKDFVPARATVDTGIIIKPNFLNRSKTKTPSVTGTRTDQSYHATIDISSVTGSEGGLFTSRSRSYNTDYSQSIQTKSGSLYKIVDNDRPKFDGELSGSNLIISNGELNLDNIFKKVNQPNLEFDIVFVLESSVNLTAFQMSNAASATDALACSSSPVYDEFYHDGAASIPVPGDIIYTDINGVTTLNGNDQWRVVNGSNIVLQISGSGVNQGTVGTGSDCSAFDSTAPSGYALDVYGYNGTFTNVSTVGSTLAYVYGGELNSTYHITSSDTNSTVLQSGTITNATTQSFNINMSSLNDGDIQVTASLSDTAGNTGAQVYDTIEKDTAAPAGHSVALSTSSTNASLALTNIPTTSNTTGGVINYTINSSGGGTQVQGSATIGSSASQSIIAIDISGLNSGTLTASVTLKDTANNRGAAATDQVTYTSAYLSITPSTYTTSDDFDSFDLTINTNQTWTATINYVDELGWITLESTSGTGNATIEVDIEANPKVTGRAATIVVSGGGLNDSMLIQQDAFN